MQCLEIVPLVEKTSCVCMPKCVTVSLLLLFIKKPIRTYHANVVCRALPSLEFNCLDIACVSIRYDDNSR